MSHDAMPIQVAVAIGHYRMPSAVELNLKVLRRRNGREFRAIVTDDASPWDDVRRLESICAEHDATLVRTPDGRLGHVGGDLRAFYHGLSYARMWKCRYLMKLSQRAIVDIPDWLQTTARHMMATGLPVAGRAAGVGPRLTAAHLRTSAIMLDVEAWSDHATLAELEPSRRSGIACESIIGDLFLRKGGRMVALPGIPDDILESRPEAPWHDSPDGMRHYHDLARRENVDLSTGFHGYGSGTKPDGTPDPEYIA